MVTIEELEARGVPHNVAVQLAILDDVLTGAMEATSWAARPYSQTLWIANQLEFYAERLRACMDDGKARWA